VGWLVVGWPRVTGEGEERVMRGGCVGPDGLCGCLVGQVVAYSFCASMMISVLSLMLAVEGGMPTSERKDLTSVAVAMV
jgi:hypothetical protein